MSQVVYLVVRKAVVVIMMMVMALVRVGEKDGGAIKKDYA